MHLMHNFNYFLTIVRVEEFSNDKLEELFGDTPLIHALLSLELYIQLSLQLLWFFLRNLMERFLG